ADVLEAVNGADIRMVQCGQHSRFTFETREPIRIARERFGKNLDRDVAAKLQVEAAIHLAHPAGAEQRVQSIAAKRATDERRSVREIAQNVDTDDCRAVEQASRSCLLEQGRD